jgi:hypothetical protein
MIDTLWKCYRRYMRRRRFGKLVWQSDRMLLDDLVFRLELNKDDRWNLGDACFHFYKWQEIVDEFAAWFGHNDCPSDNLFELGIWDGGSIAFWFECLRPRKHVAVDLMTRGDSRYFQRYLASRRLQNHVKTYWGVDQSDAHRLREIARQEFDGPLDLVIDDCSHLYDATKASFETLFPLLRPGGVYLIEDWSWAHDKDLQSEPTLAGQDKSLTELVCELVEAKGSSRAIAQITVSLNFTAVEQGLIESPSQGFRIRDQIVRWHKPTK